MKRLSFFFIFFIGVFVVHAQDHYRILELEYEYAPESRQEELLENEVAIQEYEGNLSLPIPRKNGDAYIIGFGYNDLKLFPSIGNTEEPNDTIMIGGHQYGRFRAQLGYNIKASEKRNFTMMAFYRIASDWQKINTNHYLYGGLFLVNSKKNERFTLKYGLYANTEHYGWLVIPLIGMDWKASNKLRVYGILPRRLTAEWKLNERHRAGFIFEAPNRTYRLSEGRVFTQSDGENLDTYVQNIKNVVYAYGEVYLTKSIVLRARIGYTVFREIELYEYQEEKTFITWGIPYGADRTPIADVPEYRDLEDNIVLNASIEYRFKLE